MILETFAFLYWEGLKRVWAAVFLVGPDKINSKITRPGKIHEKKNYSKASLIRINLERTLVQISESLNYRSATENIFREVIKWTLRVFLGNTTLFWNLDCIS
jgi:hypothetical protein